MSEFIRNKPSTCSQERKHTHKKKAFLIFHILKELFLTSERVIKRKEERKGKGVDVVDIVVV